MYDTVQIVYARFLHDINEGFKLTDRMASVRECVSHACLVAACPVHRSLHWRACFNTEMLSTQVPRGCVVLACARVLVMN